MNSEKTHTNADLDKNVSGTGEHVAALSKLFEGDKCMTCGCPVEGDIPLCDECDERATALQESQKQVAEEERELRRERRWEEIAGAFADVPEQMSDPIKAAVQQWDPGGKFGVTIAGEGANLTLWAFLRRAFDARLKFEVRSAGEIRSEIMSLKKHGDETPTMKRVIEAEILAFSHFGTQAATAAGDEFFTTVFEKRTRKGRPTIIATPYPGKDLAKKFFDSGTATTILEMMKPPFARVVNLNADEFRQS